MASNVTVQSLLETISTGHLECSICSCRFKQPKILDCLHSFCLQCLQELVQHQTTDRTKLICPLCRQEMKLSGSRVNDLPNDFRLSALIEELTIQEKLLKGQKSAIKCQACDEQNQAISRCMDCEHFLCQECQRAHERFTLMKSHKIYTIAQFQSGEITYRSKLREEIPKCSKHPDQSFNIYCYTCKQLLCTTCSVLQHGKHSLVDLPQAVRQCKKQIGELFAKADKQKTQFNTTIQETDTMHKKMDGAFIDTRKKISQKADKEVAKIRAEEKRLLMETEQIYKERVNKFKAVQASNRNELTKTKQKLDEVNQLVTQASSHEILELHNNILHNLTKLAEQQPDKVAEGLSFIDFEETENEGQLIGMLVRVNTGQPVKWKLKTKIGSNTHMQHGNLIAATCMSNDSIIGITDSRNQLFTCALPTCNITSITCTEQRSRRRDLLYSQQEYMYGVSTGMHTRIHTPLTKITNIIAGLNNELLILDQTTVKVFNNQYQFLRQFTPCLSSDTQPTCLAVDRNNQVAVGFAHSKVIALFNPNGSHIKTVGAPLIGEHLTIYKEQFIYTNYENQKLLSMNYDGKKVLSVDMTRQIEREYHPADVCCDSSGNIFVAVRRQIPQIITCDILQYRLDGQYIGCIIQGCSDPYGITFTPDGNLVVAGPDSINVYLQRCRPV